MPVTSCDTCQNRRTMTKTTATKAKAKKLAKRINALNRSGVSYRKISPLFSGVPAGTLSRIAKSGGEWVPKNEAELMKLGLVAERKPRRFLPKWFFDTPEARLYWMNQREKQTMMKDDTRKESHGIDTGKHWDSLKRVESLHNYGVDS